MPELLPLTSRVMRDETAVASILLAGTMLLSFAMMGFAVDYGRAEFAKSELQAALDAGALAGGRVFYTSASQMQAEALTYFGANWGQPFRASIVGGQPTYTVPATLDSIKGHATISVKTTLLWAIGQSTMLATASDKILTPSQNGGLELAVVLDNTGSEAQGCKMYYLISAAQSMVNQLYGVANPGTTNIISNGCTGSGTSATYTIPSYTKPAQPVYTAPKVAPSFFWTSIIPFVTQVAPVVPGSTDMTNWTNNGWVTSRHLNEYPVADPWAGCVEARLANVPGDTSTPVSPQAGVSPDPYGGEDAVSSNIAVNGLNLFGVELNPGQAPFQAYFNASDDDIVPNIHNPKDANYPTGEPNAPVWPAFNLWNNEVSGTAVETPTDYIITGTRPIIQTNLSNCPTVTGLGGDTCRTSRGVLMTNSGEFANGTTTNPTSYASSLTHPEIWPDDHTVPFSVTPNHNFNIGPNTGCPTPMTVMSHDYPTIMSSLAAMYPMSLGGTATNTGLAWAFRVLSPNWATASPAPGALHGTTTNVWQAGAPANSGAPSGVNLPLPYNYILTNPSNGQRVPMQKVVIFLTDGNNKFGNGGGTNIYTAYKTADHSPLFDQSPRWDATTDVAGGTIPPSMSASPPLSTLGTTTLTNRQANAATTWTNDAWALCDAMRANGIIMYTILLEYNASDISSTIANGYSQHCASDSAAGTHYFLLTGTQVSQLNTVFASIGNSVSALRVAQ